MFYISQNFEKQKKSWVKDSNPNVLKKDCSEEPVETTKGKKIEMCAQVHYYCSIPLKACLIVELFFNIAN